MQVSIDYNLCVRCGMCTTVNKQVFYFTASGAVVVNKKILPDYEDDVVAAWEDCPAGAIKIS